jgi:hypothetical protein
MNQEQEALWRRIKGYQFDIGRPEFPFAARVGRENGWTAEFTRRVIEEYRRFVFLAIAAGHPVSPPDQVDQVWHLHLLYTREYWGRFCPEVLRTPLHHGPTRGGIEERSKFTGWYEAALASYHALFGEEPPADIWPSARIRFGEDIHFRRVNVRRSWVIEKPGARLARLARNFRKEPGR